MSGLSTSVADIKSYSNYFIVLYNRNFTSSVLVRSPGWLARRCSGAGGVACEYVHIGNIYPSLSVCCRSGRPRLETFRVLYLSSESSKVRWIGANYGVHYVCDLVQPLDFLRLYLWCT